MKRLLSWLTAIGLVALPATAMAAASFHITLATAAPETFRANGNAIENWTWLRAEGDFAEWEWAPMEAAPREACLNLGFLVTNRPNGGSGHNAHIRLRITGHDGKVHIARVTLRNPFRPIVNSDSGGTGYQAHGAICLTSLARLAPKGFRLRLEWRDTGERHIAVRHDAALLAYTVRSQAPDGAPR